MDKIVKCKDLPYSRYEIENLKAAAEEFKKANAAATSAKAVEEAYRKYLAEEEKYGTFASLAYTRYTLNTKDEYYIGEQNYYDEIGPVASAISTEIGNLLLDSPFRAELAVSRNFLQKSRVRQKGSQRKDRRKRTGRERDRHRVFYAYVDDRSRLARREKTA